MQNVHGGNIGIFAEMQRLTPEEYHVPVMLRECMDHLNIRAGGIYVDATLGGGGHTSELVRVLRARSEEHTASSEERGARSGGRVIAFDADDVAIARAQERFADLPPGLLTLVHCNFVDMAEMLKVLNAAPVDGVLFDLGVSSFQFDHHGRGFSYRHEAPLDMRFTPEGTTAADIINSSTEDDLIKIFREYGEDPNAYKLGQAIVRRRALAPYRSTFDLRDTIVQHVPPQFQAKTLSRIFQALRIAVNDEIGRLEATLRSIVPLMASGGRIVVMSYHSLEDRVVKDTFKEYSRGKQKRAEGSAGEQEGAEGSRRELKVLTKKPVIASEEEVALNSRARSARLRVAEAV